MKLIFIHGAPGAGKLTTARALLKRVDGRLFDNHAAIDVARTVFDFGAQGFWELVQTVRISVIAAAAEERVPLVVMTFVYVEPGDVATFARFEEVVHRHGGQLLPVFLQCSTEAIVRRIGNTDRVARKKMSSEEGARDFMARHRVCAVPRPACLVLDSEANDADANAASIVRHFGLSAREDIV
jgi:shikimate kinase